MNKALFVILLIVFCGGLSVLVILADIALIEEHILLWSIGAVGLAVGIAWMAGDRKANDRRRVNESFH